MLKYTHKLTVRPAEMGEADVLELREAGLSDPEIGDIAINCALFAFFTRIVDGLGATLERGMLDEARRIGIGVHAEAGAS